MYFSYACAVLITKYFTMTGIFCLSHFMSVTEVVVIETLNLVHHVSRSHDYTNQLLGYSDIYSTLTSFFALRQFQQNK